MPQHHTARADVLAEIHHAQQMHTSIECCDLAVRQPAVTFYFEKSANLGDTTLRVYMIDAKSFRATEWAFMVDEAILNSASYSPFD